MYDARPTVKAGIRMCQPMTQANCNRERITGSRSMVTVLRGDVPKLSLGRWGWIIRAKPYFHTHHRMLARQHLPHDAGQEAAGRLALPERPVGRIPSASQHSEHRDHYGPKHAEFVASFRQCPNIADLKMSAPQHRHQQIRRSEQGNRAREESQCESDSANELDRSGECNLYGGHRKP